MESNTQSVLLMNVILDTHYLTNKLFEITRCEAINIFEH